MEYFLSGAGGAAWATGNVGAGVVMLVVVLLGIWSSTDGAIYSMFVRCDVGVTFLLNLLSKK